MDLSTASSIFFTSLFHFIYCTGVAILLYRKASKTESEKPAKQVLVDRAPAPSGNGEGASQVADGSKTANQKEVSLALTYSFSSLLAHSSLIIQIFQMYI